MSGVNRYKKNQKGNIMVKVTGNNNQKSSVNKSKSLIIKTGIKAGFNPQPDPPGDHG